MIAIANCSGFFGDRIAAAREMVDAHREGRAHIDVLTGDWLAELTMGVLAKQRERHPDRGYAGTFVRALSDVLADCLDADIRVVANAGGLDPAGCAATVSELVPGVRVACVDGDDVTGRLPETPTHLETGEVMAGDPVVANAYLGCWGIVEALEQGAQVVVTGRVTDAAVVVAPAAWRHGWARDDWDALAGAVAAGHVIECGAQATGGNFSFAGELAGMEHAGFPIAEIEADGSAVITKASGTGGGVTTETVTAQLLYEIDGARYPTPDVVARLDTAALTAQGPDRVRISGVRGEPAPDTVKVGIILPAGWHNEVTLVLTGLDVDAKAELALATLWDGVPGGRGAFDRVEVRLLRAGVDDPTRMTEAVSLLTVAVAGDEKTVNRLPRAATETALSGYAGFFATSPPGPGRQASTFFPTLVPAADVPQRVSFEGRTWTATRAESGTAPGANGTVGPPGGAMVPFAQQGSSVRAPLGRVVGSRSGDKGGNATLGLWARTDDAHAWLASWWDPEHVRWLLGHDAAGCALRLWELPRLRAVGVTVVGFLGRGVGDSLALDPQAKGLGEFVRARYVDIPEELLP